MLLPTLIVSKLVFFNGIGLVAGEEQFIHYLH